MDRRHFLVSASALALTGPALAETSAYKPILTDDGLYKEPWFLESFLDLSEDLEGARKQNKRFVIMWELKGCPYCKETHFVNFAQPRVSDYIHENFEVLQLNIIGSRKVTDFDGKEIGEKELAAKYGIRYTPTFQFFRESAEGLAALPPADREVARAPGYLRPDDFLAMFRFVREKAYEGKSFRDFLKSLPS
ncbi:MAG: thioredoxin family protein [Pseudolabrys sp.]|nr:thioredoxin family protein [Pseudolabrys sp.]